MTITVTGGEICKEEIKEYVNRAYLQKPYRKLLRVSIHVDGDYVDLEYEYEPVGFERIRRITGYLVGSLDRFNNAKRTEVGDRVTHSVSDDCEDVYIGG